MSHRIRNKLSEIGSRIVVAAVMTLAGGLLVGAILVRTLLVYPDTSNTLEQHNELAEPPK